MKYVIGVFIIFCLHVIGLCLLFDPAIGIINDNPVIEQDWCLHWHHLKSTEAFWKSDHSLWGMNPYFMAGYVSNTIQDFSIKFFELLALFTPGLGITQAFKIWVVLFHCAIPWLLYYAGLNFFFELKNAQRASFFICLLGTMSWWNSYPREMFFFGMIGFPFSIYICLLTVALFYRLLKTPKVSYVTIFSLAVCALILPAVHLMGAMITVVICLIFLSFNINALNKKKVTLLILAFIASIVLNWPWFGPFLAHLKNSAGQNIIKNLPIFYSPDPLTIVKDYFLQQNYWSFRYSWWNKGLRIFLLFFGIAGIFTLHAKYRKLSLTLAVSILILCLTAYFGSLIPGIRTMQPLRFKIILDLWLTLPAAFYANRILSQKSLGVEKRLTAISLALSLIVFICFAINLYETESKLSLHLRTNLSPGIEKIIQTVEKETTPNSRILFEESGDETGHFYDGMFLSSILAHKTNRKLIGGPLNLYNDVNHYAEFHSGLLFKHDISELSPAEIERYLDLYNIGYIISFMPKSLNAFARLGNKLELIYRIGNVYLLKRKKKPNWFLIGNGNLQADFNRIKCSDVSGEKVVLKYHWNPYLKANDPAVKLKKFKLPNTSEAFIQIDNPPEEFTLSFSN